ncbi:MAG: response regulator [Myxococcaceae bacterium]
MIFSEHEAFGRPARVLMGVAEVEARAALTVELQREGYDVENTTSGLELRVKLLGATLAGEPYELVVVDLDLPGPSVLEAIPGGGSGPKVIVITRAIPEPLSRDAQRVGAVVVDRWLSAEDIRDCAIELLPPHFHGSRTAA